MQNVVGHRGRTTGRRTNACIKLAPRRAVPGPRVPRLSMLPNRPPEEERGFELRVPGHRRTNSTGGGNARMSLAPGAPGKKPSLPELIEEHHLPMNRVVREPRTQTKEGGPVRECGLL